MSNGLISSFGRGHCAVLGQGRLLSHCLSPPRLGVLRGTGEFNAGG